MRSQAYSDFTLASYTQSCKLQMPHVENIIGSDNYSYSSSYGIHTHQMLSTQFIATSLALRGPHLCSLAPVSDTLESGPWSAYSYNWVVLTK